MSAWAQVRAWLVRDRDDALRRRRPGDLVRALVAAALFALLAWHAGEYYAWERAFTRFLLTLPDDLHSLVRLAYGLLALWAVGLAVAAAVLARRWRLARDVAVAGVAAWVIGRTLAFLVKDTDLADAFRIAWEARGAPPFPLVRVAVGVAVISVAGGYLTRPTRWVGRSLVLGLGVVALYLGRGYVTDLLGAVMLGWGVANVVKFAFGTPIGRPTVGDVGGALSALGVEFTELQPEAEQPLGRARFVARGSADDTTLRIVALGRDEADAQLLARSWRYVAYRDSAPTLFPTRRQQIEYEAFVCLLAGQAGVRVGRVVAAGVSGSIALLVVVDPPGVPLAQVAPDRVSDALLDDTWRQVETLHRANVVHGALDADHVLVTDDESALVGWRHAVATSSSHAIGRDRANLLAASSALVGPDRAVAAARRALADDALAATLPMLQPPALTGATGDALDGADGIDAALGRLSEQVATAVAAEVPEPRRLYRVAPRQLLMAVGALFAVGVLLSRIGDPQEFWNSIRDASWAYVALAFVLGLGTDAAFAVAFMGTVPVRLPLWPCIELQSSLSFANLAVPIAADTAIQIRFLQKHGLELSEAVATGGILSSVSEIIVQLGLFVVALWLAPDTIDFGHIDTNQVLVVVAIAIFVLGVGSAIVFGVRRIRARLLPSIVRALRAVWASVRSPSRIALMIGGNVLAQCLYAASLLACLHAFGASIDFWTLLALNIGISLIASLVPVPGGSTAVSAIGLSGMFVTLGVPAGAAAAAVLAHQVAVTYLPAVPGWFAGNDLSRRGLL